jgi:arylsulfatase A-like enzyme
MKKLAFLLGILCTISVQGQQKPNFIVILADDHGYGDLSYTGGKDIQTPNLDELIGRGAFLTNFYTNSTVCSPTRASLLTGKYSDMSGVPGVIRTNPENNWGHFRNDLPTLPSKLKLAGYHTAIVGKWHLGLESPNTPNERGFDYFKGFLGDMMDSYYTHRRHGINYMRLNGDSINPKGHATDLFAQWAIDYVKEKSQSKNPFFLYLAFNAPHFPIQPPKEWLEKVRKREPGISEKRARNIALVEHMDDAIGRLIQQLDVLGLSQNTIIVYSSDNGGSLPHSASNGELRGGKGDLYEGGIKSPGCIVWPAMIKPNSKLSILTLTMDIMPTLCEIAGVNPGNEIDGRSLLPILNNEKKELPDRSVFFMRREGGNYAGLCYYAARNNRYKLVQNSPFEPIQMFDIIADPLEKNPLNQNSEEYKKLFTELTQHIRLSGNIKWQ